MAIGSGRQSRHLRWAAFLFLLDFGLIWNSFFFGIGIRFGSISWEKLLGYGPGIGLASLAMPALFYIGGLYSPRLHSRSWVSDFRWILLGFLAVLISILVVGSLDFSARVGRGVLVTSLSILSVTVILRHVLIVRRRRRRVDSFLCLVAGKTDEEAALKLSKLWGNRAHEFGIVSGGGYEPASSLPYLGKIEDFVDGPVELGVDVVLVRDRHFADALMASFLRSLRYAGAEILPLSDACEDAYHAVPLEIITDAWLFRASNQSQLFYIRKLKRLSDIFLAILFLALLSPFLLLGILVVKIASPGPIIFRQERAGRFGRPFTVLKLRTMHLVSESDGVARWADQETVRIFRMGNFLRTFRIDEIPQLVNVLRGEMSFVGPRPEQVSIVEDLAEVIPFYRERLLIQPGITGWAQVNYPYGASVEDAARKLEYDLYYMKHMGIFLDFFIILETVKIILTGGVSSMGDRDYLAFRGDMASLKEELEEIKERGATQRI